MVVFEIFEAEDKAFNDGGFWGSDVSDLCGESDESDLDMRAETSRRLAQFRSRGEWPPGLP